jgi:hypothetical protein
MDHCNPAASSTNEDALRSPANSVLREGAADIARNTRRPGATRATGMGRNATKRRGRVPVPHQPGCLDQGKLGQPQRPGSAADAREGGAGRPASRGAARNASAVRRSAIYSRQDARSPRLEAAIPPLIHRGSFGCRCEGRLWIEACRLRLLFLVAPRASNERGKMPAIVAMIAKIRKLARVPDHGSNAHDWDNFYVTTGAASAPLIGLLFVMVTLAAGFSSSDATIGARAFFDSCSVSFWRSAAALLGRACALCVAVADRG